MATIHARLLEQQELFTAHGTFSARLYRGTGGDMGLALWMGNLKRGAVLASRLHSSCFTSEGLGALDCDCATQLDKALSTIAEARHGIVFYLLQEGRGAGLRAKVRDRELVQRSGGTIDTFGAYEQLGLPHDLRSYSMVPAMCNDLGVSQTLRLMTNNPAKVAALAAAGLSVVRVQHELPPSEFNAAYLSAKGRSGHALRVPSVGLPALPPRYLEGLDPHASRLGAFRRVASYALPIRVSGKSVWFRATAYWEPMSGHDRVVLSYREAHSRSPERPKFRHVYRETLSERFQSGEPSKRYRAALERIVAHGAGSVLAVPADPGLLLSHRGPSAEDDRVLLDAHDAAVGATAWQQAERTP